MPLPWRSIGSMLRRRRRAVVIAHARLGDADSARREFELAEPRLRAVKETDLIRRCDEALGNRQ